MSCLHYFLRASKCCDPIINGVFVLHAEVDVKNRVIYLGYGAQSAICFEIEAGYNIMNELIRILEVTGAFIILIHNVRAIVFVSLTIFIRI